MVTFIRTCSAVQRLLQPSSAPLKLVPAVEDIGLVAVDSTGTLLIVFCDDTINYAILCHLMIFFSSVKGNG